MTTVNQIETIRDTVKGLVDRAEIICNDDAEDYELESVKTAVLISLTGDDFNNHGFSNATEIERKVELMVLSKSYYSKTENYNLLTLIDRITSKIKNVIPDGNSTQIQIESRKILRKKNDLFRATISINYKCDQFN
jgi:hypothetical protein